MASKASCFSASSFSVFLLYDWYLFGRTKGLGVFYLLTPAIVLVVNAVRIASIFLYAEWTLAHGGASVATSNTIEAFHHNAGLVLYTALFAMILPLLYRWARRQSDVRQPVQDSDGPASR